VPVRCLVCAAGGRAHAPYDDDRPREADRDSDSGDPEQQQVYGRHRDQGTDGDHQPRDHVDEP